MKQHVTSDGIGSVPADAADPVDATAAGPSQRFANIQVLRLLAAVGVVLHHLGHYGPKIVGVGRDWLKFPLFVGFPVPLFFAVSGFVLAQAVRRSGPGRYLLARALRLYPGYWLALVVTMLLMRGGVFTEGHRLSVGAASFGTLTLWPRGSEGTVAYLGVEWSLIYELFLSAALAALVLVDGRRLPELAAAWLGVILAKVIYRPNLYSEALPHWGTIALSGFNAPFLYGLMAYQLKDRGRSLRWVAVAAIPACMAFAATRPTLELSWLWWGAAGVAMVWLATQLPQISERNLLARLGGCTYGLFLVHVPLLFCILYPAARLGWQGRVEPLWLAGAAAIIGGLGFGRLEAAIHSRLRHWSDGCFRVGGRGHGTGSG